VHFVHILYTGFVLLTFYADNIYKYIPNKKINDVHSVQIKWGISVCHVTLATV